MGLFDKISKAFEKKSCDICGGEIGLLGNRKLEDGNLCKNCAAKLSPWFSERRQSTVAQIREQLDYREANLEEVKRFHTTRSLGTEKKLLIDEDAGKFMITSARDLTASNPDVLNLSQVTGCVFDIDEDQDEITRKDSEGKTVSYNPKRYKYSYDFYITVQVNHPYFDEMKFKLNRSSVDTGETRIGTAQNVRRPYGGGSTADAVINGVFGALNAMTNTGAGYNTNPEFEQYRQMGEEIKAVLTGAREAVRAEAAPKKAVICPYCNATTVPDANGRCEYCGGSIQ